MKPPIPGRRALGGAFTRAFAGAPPRDRTSPRPGFLPLAGFVPFVGFVRLVALVAFVAFVALHGAPTSAQAQTAAASPSPPGTSPYTLTMATREDALEVTLKADAAPLATIAEDLAKRLRAPIRLGPSLRTETVTVDLTASPLEPVLASLAPRVLVDYEIRQGAPSRPHEIHLLGLADAEPSRNTDARGRSQGLLITGHTEQSTEASAEDPLRVNGDKRQLTLTSKGEPLVVVATAIAELLGVPIEIRYDAMEPIQVDIRNVPAEDLIPRISPNLRLHVRADLSKAERLPLRLVVARPSVD